MAFFIPHGNGDARLVNCIPEGTAAFFRRAFPREPLHGVVRDEIDFGVQAFGDPDEMGRVFWRIVDVPDENVFQRGHLVSSPVPFLKGRNELGERPFFVDRHDLVSDFVRSSVQGNGQTDLPGIGRQFFQAGNESRRGDGDVARPYFQTAVGSDDFQGIRQVVKIGEGFPHAHEDDVVDPFSRNGFRRENLPDDFPRGEVAFKAQQPGSAEFAAEGAAYLGRNAKGDALRFFSIFRCCGRDDDGFYQTAVFHFGEEFSCGVRRTVDFHDFRRVETEIFRQQIFERGREVAHRVKGGDAFAPHPVQNLLGAEFSVPVFRQEGEQLFLRLGSDEGKRWHGFEAVPLQQGIHVAVPVEGFKVFDSFPGSQKGGGNVHFIHDGYGHASLSGTVHFGDNDGIQGRRFMKFPGLCQGVSACGGIHHQQGAVGGGCILLGESPANFGEFLHEVVARMEAPRSIANEVLEAFPDGLRMGLIADGGRILAGGSLADGDVQLVRPALKLFHSGRSKSVRRSEEDAGALFLQQMGQFGRRSGFPGAVDAHDQNDQRFAFRRGGQGRSGGRKGPAKHFTGGFHQIFRIQAFAFLQLVRNTHSAPDADVRGYQLSFQFFPVYPGASGKFGE